MQQVGCMQPHSPMLSWGHPVLASLWWIGSRKTSQFLSTQYRKIPVSLLDRYHRYCHDMPSIFERPASRRLLIPRYASEPLRSSRAVCVVGETTPAARRLLRILVGGGPDGERAN